MQDVSHVSVLRPRESVWQADSHLQARSCFFNTASYSRVCAQVLWPVYAASQGEDGYVSIEVSPEVALDTQRTIDSARYLHGRSDHRSSSVKDQAARLGCTYVFRSFEILV